MTTVAERTIFRLFTLAKPDFFSFFRNIPDGTQITGSSRSVMRTIAEGLKQLQAVKESRKASKLLVCYSIKPPARLDMFVMKIFLKIYLIVASAA